MIFQITDKQKSLFAYLMNSTVEDAEIEAATLCEFYLTETRVYHNGCLLARYLCVAGKAVRDDLCQS